jgi:hypothetical protein
MASTTRVPPCRARPMPSCLASTRHRGSLGERVTKSQSGGYNRSCLFYRQHRTSSVFPAASVLMISIRSVADTATHVSSAIGIFPTRSCSVRGTGLILCHPDRQRARRESSWYHHWLFCRYCVRSYHHRRRGTYCLKLGSTCCFPLDPS